MTANFRAVRFHRLGDPVDVLAVEEIAAAPPGEDEVVIRVEASRSTGRTGSTVGASIIRCPTCHPGSGPRRGIAFVEKAVPAGISPRIDSRFGFDGVLDAYRRLDSHDQTGKIVVRLDPA